MLSLISLIQLVCFLVWLSYINGQWTITLVNPQISTMEKGLFYDIRIQFKSGEGAKALPNVEFKLEDSKKVFRTSKPVYKINLFQETEIDVMLGVTCTTDLTDASFSFVPINTLEVAKSIDYHVAIKTPTTPISVSLSISSPTVSKGEYGLLFPTKTIRNVDELALDIKSSDPLLSFEAFSYPVYNPSILPSKIYGKYWYQGDAIFGSPLKLDIAFDKPTACFVLSTPAFNIKVGENKIKDTSRQMVQFKSLIADLSQLDIIPTNYPMSQPYVYV